MEVTITNENFESLKNGDKPLVVDFWATWCGPCRMVGPIISQLAEEYDGRIVVGKCDVEEADDVAAEMGIRNIPTIMFLRTDNLLISLSVPPPKQSCRKSSTLCFNFLALISQIKVLPSGSTFLFLFTSI